MPASASSSVRCEAGGVAGRGVCGVPRPLPGAGEASPGCGVPSPGEGVPLPGCGVPPPGVGVPLPWPDGVGGLGAEQKQSVSSRLYLASASVGSRSRALR